MMVLLAGAVVAAVFFRHYGYSLQAVRCIAISLILMIAGLCDWRSYEIPDRLHLLLLLAGCLGIKLVPALLGLLVVPLPFLTAAIYTDGKIGGGDIKLMATAGFCIGVTKGIGMMVIGLFLGICWSCIYQREQSDASLPLAPFLAVGGILALL